MKKAIAILLVLIIALSLFACKGNDTQTPDQQAPSASAPASDSAPSSAPPSESASAPASASTQPSQTPGGAETFVAGTIGFWEDALESAKSGRDRYHIVMLSTNIFTQWTYMTDMSTMFEDILNIRVTSVSANGDGDRMITLVEEQCADRSVDGLILDISTFYQERSKEILDENGMNYVNIMDAMYIDMDQPSNRRCVAPSCVVDPYDTGVVGLQWCADNYKSFWGDIDTSTLGFVGATYSASYDLNQRAVGAYDTFGTLFPEAADNRYYADTVVGDMNVDTFYQEVTATLTAHPEVEHWFLFAASGDSGGIGSIRGIEDSGKDDVTIMVSGVPTTATIEWDSGSDNAWVASVDQSYPLTLATAFSGVIAMADGRATMETLWEAQRTGNHISTLLIIAPSVITRDNYKQSRNEQYQAYGLPKAYPDV